ncbi:MAG: hypothetical protein AAFQ43_04265 [Bacteroidota bacterium]
MRRTLAPEARALLKAPCSVEILRLRPAASAQDDTSGTAEPTRASGARGR